MVANKFDTHRLYTPNRLHTWPHRPDHHNHYPGHHKASLSWVSLPQQSTSHRSLRYYRSSSLFVCNHRSRRSMFDLFWRTFRRPDRRSHYRDHHTSPFAHQAALHMRLTTVHYYKRVYLHGMSLYMSVYHLIVQRTRHLLCNNSWSHFHQLVHHNRHQDCCIFRRSRRLFLYI